jgi:hypothetical protein
MAARRRERQSRGMSQDLGFGRLIYREPVDCGSNSNKVRGFSAKTCSTNLQQICSVVDTVLVPKGPDNLVFEYIFGIVDMWS